MPAEVKRVQSGVYLLFLGRDVLADELAQAVNRYTTVAQQESPEGYALVIDPLHLNNPLAVARILPALADPATTHYVVVGSTSIGMILAERIRQKLGGVVEVAPHQEAAVTRARELRDLPALPNAHACDYL